MSARSSTQGPTPVSSDRVMTTVMPCACRMRRTRLATSQVKACSGYPAFVSVPVVSHALRAPYPAGTSRLISAVWLALPPLWPGLRTTVSPPPPPPGGAAEETGADVRCRCDGDERAFELAGGAELAAEVELEAGAELDGGAERAEDDGAAGVEGCGTADPV